MARPSKSPAGLTRSKTFRLTPEVIDKLAELSVAHGISQAEVVQRLVLHHPYGEPLPEFSL